MDSLNSLKMGRVRTNLFALGEPGQRAADRRVLLVRFANITRSAILRRGNFNEVQGNLLEDRLVNLLRHGPDVRLKLKGEAESDLGLIELNEKGIAKPADLFAPFHLHQQISNDSGVTLDEREIVGFRLG